MLIGNHDEPDKISLNGTGITNRNNEKLLGVVNGKKTRLYVHIKSLYKKAAQKLSALAKVSSHLTSDQKLQLINSVIKSQFSYCPLIWMFCSRFLNNSLNHIHKRALRLIYDDHTRSFQDKVETRNEKTIHKKNLECLAKEIYKFLRGLSPSITFETSSHFSILDKLCDFEMKRLRTKQVQGTYFENGFNTKKVPQNS